MRDQVSDDVAVPLRPTSDRVEAPLLDAYGRAAGVGRIDALGRDGVLGLQRTVGNAGVVALLETEAEPAAEADSGVGVSHEERSPVHDVIGSGGRALDQDVRADMESRLGHDFGDVRVHDDAAATASAQAVNAHAYTVGADIVFSRDRYDPTSTQGRTTLAHELTHVVQQRSGPVEGTPAPGGIQVSDPADRFEREAVANAERVLTNPAVQRDEAGPTTTAAVVQRADGVGERVEEEVGEDEPVQGSFVQRDTAEEAPDEVEA